MSVKSRQRLGWILIVIAMAGVVVLGVLGRQPVVVHSSEGPDIAIGPVRLPASSFVVFSTVPLRYAAPVVLCGIAGMVCLLWPQRRQST